MFLFKFSASAAIYFSLSLVAIISITITRTKAQPIDINFAQYDCPNTSTFSPNSTFHSNLKTLLSWLPFNASHENGYYRTSIFESPESTVYGALLCRGDLTDAGCQYCGSIAVGAVLERCPVEEQSIIWYAQCMLRYSNQYFFSAVQVRPSRSLQSVDDISGQSRFRQLLDETMGKLADDAANGKGRNGTKFATREANFSSSKILYTLAQCTPDITVADCKECLQTAIRHLPSEKEGGRVMTPSCNVRFETAPFYTPSQVVAPPTIIESLPELKGEIRIPAGVFVAVVVSIVLFSLLLLFACWFTTRRARKKYISRTEENGEISSVEFLQFDLETINVATNNFSDDNKLGQGGFGAVYKGLLANGQYIAVKRLSRSSSQGAEEFKNEVVLVAKLQHRNLVRLLGFCLDGEEKILIYEFVTNNSLDHFLFDPDKKHRLHWSRRYKIIEGISRGLLYLHEDSRLKIIHRDLKASNILLDENLNSKISDFGMARIFCVDQTQANTNRIVGTFGYMPPEYALHGHLSVKLDVYSFGILVLEIISGKRNTSFHESGYAEDLLNYAWKKWREGTPLDLLDMSLKDSYSRDEVIRCIHIGLLCIQEDPAERPTMQAVVLMLNSHSVSLAMPQRPPSFLHSRSTAAGEPIPLSVDEATITEVYSR